MLEHVKTSTSTLTFSREIQGSEKSQRSSWLSSMLPSSQRTSSSTTQDLNIVVAAEEIQAVEGDDNPEMRLPSIKSLILVIGGNAFFQFSFFVVVPSANAYVEYLGGSSTYSGLVIGVPTIFSGIMLLLVKRFDGGQYRRPFAIAYISALVGNIIYAVAFAANRLYLLLIARMFVGISFTSFMYSRKYCTDPRLVGIRRRTMLASWYVVAQAFGFSAGPWAGGMLYKAGFGNAGFNGYTAPGWVVAGIWLIFLVASWWFFEDVPKPTIGAGERRPAIGEIEMNMLPAEIENEPPPSFLSLTGPQKYVLFCMCYYSTAYFFVLASWETNIPVFTAAALDYTPYQAGNLLALGGVTTFPFLFLNVRYAYRIQDRTILFTGTSIGLLGIILFLVFITTNTIRFASLYAAWFLVALGFNLASTCTLSLLSKQLPGSWNTKASMAVQYSNYIGRITGAIMGGAGVKMGMVRYTSVQVAVVILGVLLHLVLWRELKAKKG